MNALVFRDVGKAFVPGVPVLQGFTAEVPLDRVTFVVGRSGSGKSVLCRLAVGLLRPDAGEVELLGRRVDRAPERELRQLRAEVPYIVQGPALLDWYTVGENVALADPERSVERAREALRRVGLDALWERYPPTLGPGVKKRVAIARALVLKPRYLVLDEPTTGLDRAAAAQVNEVIRSLKRAGLGALVVSHDYRALQAVADQVLLVANGKRGFQGTAAEFASSGEAEIRALTAP